MHSRAYLSLGSNLGDRATNLERAIAQMAALGTVAARSADYETEPIDVQSQPWFLNAAAALDTSLSPEGLLSGTLAIEREMGRLRSQAKGARVIDIDILLVDDLIVDTPQLIVPHPAMARRRFVLEPLAEIAPDAVHPVLHKTVRELLQALPDGQVVRRISSTQGD